MLGSIHRHQLLADFRTATALSSYRSGRLELVSRETSLFICSIYIFALTFHTFHAERIGLVLITPIAH